MYKNLKDTPAYRYASAVIEGKKSFRFQGKKYNSLVGKLTRLGVQRFFRDLEKFDLDWKRGYMPILFAENFLKHWKGSKAGQLFILEPHQHFYILNQFGFLLEHKTLGYVRRFNRSYYEVARKNGKTSMVGLKALYHITADNEVGAQFYVSATKEEQALLAVNDAGIIAQNSELASQFKFQKYGNKVKSIYFKENSSVIRPLGRDSLTQDGLDPSWGAIDEYHAHKNTDAVDVLESGIVARAQGMIDIITTAGFNKAYPCYNLTRKLSVNILSKKMINDKFYANIYTLDEDDDPEDYNNWIKANPNLGVSVELSTLKANFKTAKQEGQSKIVNFYTKNLNIWTDAPEVWIPSEKWNRCVHGITEEELREAKAYGGLDLGTSSDFNSFALVFPNLRDNIVAVKVMFWLPKNSIRNRKDSNDFTDWVHDDYIRISGEDVTDFRTMAQGILDFIEPYNVEGVAYDRYKATHGSIQILEEHNIECFDVPQWHSALSTPTTRFEEVVTAGGLEHFDNPCLSWQLGNVVISMDSNGNIKPDKKKSANKIDGIASTINAFALWMSKESDNKGGILAGYMKNGKIYTADGVEIG
jgi:phage terminase large subunit-like protein